MAEKGGHWVKSAGGGMSFKQAGSAGGGGANEAANSQDNWLQSLLADNGRSYSIFDGPAEVKVYSPRGLVGADLYAWAKKERVEWKAETDRLGKLLKTATGAAWDNYDRQQATAFRRFRNAREITDQFARARKGR